MYTDNVSRLFLSSTLILNSLHTFITHVLCKKKANCQQAIISVMSPAVESVPRCGRAEKIS